MPPSLPELEAAFKTFDVDNSGTLSVAELTAILTREGGGKPLAETEAEALVKTVDVNGDGELDLQEFCALMAAQSRLQLPPAPPATPEERFLAFENETKAVKRSSPVLAIFERVAGLDPALTALELNMGPSDNAINMEFCMWPDARKAAALSLVAGNSHITSLNLAGCKLTDKCARALALVLSGATNPSCETVIETVNLERNALSEAGLLEIIAALKANTTLRELKLAGQSKPLTTAVEVSIADLLDGGGAPSLVKLGPPMRNPNEKRRVEAGISRNMDLIRKRRRASQIAIAAEAVTEGAAEEAAAAKAAAEAAAKAKAAAEAAAKEAAEAAAKAAAEAAAKAAAEAAAAKAAEEAASSDEREAETREREVFL